MHILIFPMGFILWYLAYEAKPNINDEVTINWEEKNTNKRNKITSNSNRKRGYVETTTFACCY